MYRTLIPVLVLAGTASISGVASADQLVSSKKECERDLRGEYYVGADDVMYCANTANDRQCIKTYGAGYQYFRKGFGKERRDTCQIFPFGSEEPFVAAKKK